VIAEIRLENFKRFCNLNLRTANLTVLTGANGAGKTSVLQALLLARQMDRQPGRSHVEFNGVDTLELGGPEDVIHREASDDLAAVEVVDTRGKHRRWSFRAASADDTRTLNATVVDRPDDDPGALAGPAPQFCYLGAERLGPRDVLSASAANVAELDVGVRGEFVAQVLASFDRSRVSAGRLEGSSTETQISSLLHQTESWMSKIVRPTQIDAEWFPNTLVTRLRFKTPGIRAEWTRAPNAGFGISYALPVVVAALRAEVGGLLLVENPEAHLHPAGQSKIGSFLARVAADGVQIFLETHSDHVLNGIRVAVADGSAVLLPEQVAIHFFRVQDDGPALQSMELQRTGQLTAWPAGFFDQAQVDLAALASKRRRNL
jgi:predicted ATPase